MRILVDYRPALRARTGVGEYMHGLIGAYAAAHPGDVAIFTSSWKDRPAVGVATELGVEVVDRRVPVRLLNLLWHRAGWPPVEMLAGRADVVHAAHPLLIPARHAAQVVTIHDLFVLSQPERTEAEIRRDYPSLIPPHARRADAIVTPSAHVKRQVVERLGVAEDRVYVCSAGAPQWRTLGRAPNVPRDGYVLFVGTLEPRKNVGTLLDAYARLLERRAGVPPLVLAGRATADAGRWLRRIAEPPLAGHVRHLGYVAESERERVYAGARALVMPSLDEGFGLPALEAMSAGIPLIASDRGSLPEVVGTGGMLLGPADVDAWTDALDRILSDEAEALAWSRAGLERARAFTWTGAAATLHRAYGDAVVRRDSRRERR
jgi:glycosyltransferase involved in cell wall biosynthesis